MGANVVNTALCPAHRYSLLICMFDLPVRMSFLRMLSPFSHMLCLNRFSSLLPAVLESFQDCKAFRTSRLTIHTVLMVTIWHFFSLYSKAANFSKQQNL